MKNIQSRLSSLKFGLAQFKFLGQHREPSQVLPINNLLNLSAFEE